MPYVYCFNCRIHAGFYADYLLLEPAVNAKVQKLVDAHPTATILASGHSLGAALASISAMQLKMKFNNRVVIHNFGSPRIGNPNLAKHIMNRVDTVYRVVHNRDIVPHLPPDLLPFDYHHPAFEVFFDEAMENYKVCSSTGEDGSCSNKFFPDYSTDDHDFYFVNISKTKC